MRDVNEDTAAHDVVMDRWQDLGNECRVIRSHRRPRNTRRGPVALLALAAAVSLGITTNVIASEPEPTTTSTQAAVFVPAETEQDLIDRLFEPPTRSERDELQEMKAEKLGKTKADKPKTKAKPKPKSKPVPAWRQPVKSVEITSCYGPRWGTTHKGIDYDGETGDKIRAVGAGTVVQAGWRYSGYGYSVVVRHPGGWMTLYGHLSRVTARPGQKVSAGDLVGLMGSTGHSTGSHLHLALAKTSNLSSIFNSFVNPASWLRGHGIPAGRCA